MNKEGVRLAFCLYIIIIFASVGFYLVSASNSVAMPSDCNNMISYLSVNSNPLIISVDVENKFIYVSFKEGIKKVAAFEYADCFRNIDGLIKNQIYEIGNVKINYYDSKSSKGITGNAVSDIVLKTPATTKTPTARTTRSAATTKTTPGAIAPGPRSATTAKTPSTSSVSTSGKTTSSGNSEIKINSLVAFRGYKYFADDSGKRSQIYARKDGAVYLQKPSFGGVATDYFWPDKKLGAVSAEPAGNFIDLEASVENVIGSEVFSRLNGKIINDAGKISSASDSKELKITGVNGGEADSGITIDERGYLRPASNKNEKIGEIDKTGKISMYNPSNYSASTRKSIGAVAEQIHNTKATNGTIKSLAKVDSKGYVDPNTKKASPVIATKTPSTTTRTNASRIVANPTTPGTPNTPGKTSPGIVTNPTNPVTPNPVKPLPVTPSPSATACEKSCQSSTGYTPPAAGAAVLTVVTQLQTAYSQCLQLKCSSAVKPGLPGTGPGIGTPGKPSPGSGGSPGGGGSPGSGGTAGGNAASAGGNCRAGTADAGPCSCDVALADFSGDCTNTPGVAGTKPQYKTFSCRSNGGATNTLEYNWVPNVINCDGLDKKSGCKIEGSKCSLTDNPISCPLTEGSTKNDGKKKCEQDKTTLVCDWGKCSKEKSADKPVKKVSTAKKKTK